MRGEDDQVAGDVCGEQSVEAEKADDVGASGNDAQHDQQALDGARVTDGRRRDQWSGLQLPPTPSPTIFLGSTISSKRFSSIKPESSAASFKVRSASFALCAIADALS